MAVAAIDLTVVALQSDGDVTAIPPGDRTLRAGETVYVVGRPEGIRRLETRAKRGSDASNRTSDPTGSEASTPNVGD